ncbi:MAG: PKD domain-containing protein [Bacteroidia bacterium]|nr:PKD domain-containing protein [Bacteroidia bacterium]
MNHRLPILPALLLLLQAVCTFPSSAQTADPEYWGNCWEQSLQGARNELRMNENAFLKFYYFELAGIDSLRGTFMRGAKSGKSPQQLIKSGEKSIIDLYGKFELTKASYPSSVNNYREDRAHRVMGLCDTGGCYNIGFEQGTLDGWNAYYGYNNNPGVNLFNITNITGGPAGPVTQAANDVLTSNPSYYNSQVGPNSSPDYQIFVKSGLQTDALVPSLTQVSPYGGLFSVMLGDSTQVNYGVAILSKTFKVKPGSTDFTYQYAVVLENPYSHTYYQQPFFEVVLLDQNGDTIPSCGTYFVVSSGGQAAGWNPVFVPPNGSIGGDTAYYKNWTVVSVPLKKYVGQCVTIVFETGDCGKGGHFGYAYVDATCSPLEILSSSKSFCGQKTVTLTGPPGFTNYIWSGPPGGIKSGNGTHIVTVDSAGIYSLVAIPVTGAACADTLSIRINDTAGPAPIPSFSAYSACVGQPVQFTNTSNPINGNGVKFYWDFYNLGIYQDSGVNASWTYNTAGVYDVKLYEYNHGCGADTVIKITVAPPPDVVINSPPSVCIGDSVTLTATITSSYTPDCYFKWNTGSTGNSITIAADTAKTYFYVITTCGCADTAYRNISVFKPSGVNACCDTTITAGDTVTIKAWGDFTYRWSPDTGVFCPACGFTPAQPFHSTVYTVAAVDENGCRSTGTVDIHVEPCDYYWVPDAFSPGQGDVNNYFEPKGWCMRTYNMYIFNRWGELIYHSNGIPWDGKYDGHFVPEDVYVCKIIITTWDYQQHSYVGKVTVLR